jgi:excisionase family DNA binding protein
MTTHSKPSRPGPVAVINEQRVVWLSIASAASRIGVSTRTIKRWIAAQLLPATRLPSPKNKGHLRIRLTDLESVMAQGCSS